MQSSSAPTINPVEKPMLSFWQIWNMCFGFLGIQFGFALQNSNVSRIFQTLGADIDDIPILWIAAPVTGLIVQPIVGHFSDKTWGKLGRRRPYFLWGAILTSLALIAMPNSPTLWFAAGALWILDASINISMEPFRALVGDMLPEKQRTNGYAMQSFFIGIGAIVASALPWILSEVFNVANTAPEGVIPLSVQISFYAGAVILVLAIGWTIYATKEYSPEELEAFDQAEKQLKQRNEKNMIVETSTKTIQDFSHNRNGFIWLVGGGAIWYLVETFGLDKQLFILASGLGIFGLIQLSLPPMIQKQKTEGAYFQIIENLFLMPKVMKQLAVVQFFSWFALFSMWIYTTAGVTSFHYDTIDPSTQAYNKGADWVGVLFAAYNGFAAIAAIFIPMLVKRFGRRKAHLFNMCLGGLGLISFVVIDDPRYLIISMIGVGFAWASILSIPYALLAGCLPSNKMGVFMGVFNFFIVIPQILAATVLGFFVNTIFGGEPIYALVLGGILMILGGITTLFVSSQGVSNS